MDAVKGKRAADLIFVPPGTDKGGRPRKGDETGTTAVPVSGSKDDRLRAILRAPEVIQALYRDGLITQADAAKLGPRSPTPEKAARVAEGWKAERMSRLFSVYLALGVRRPTCYIGAFLVE